MSRLSRSLIRAIHLPSTRTGTQTPLDARTAYDLFADRYDKWSWQEFWRRNEWSHLKMLVESGPSSLSILDVGTGTGFYLAQLVADGRTAFGVDISYGMLKAARRRIGERGWLIQADAVLLPFRSGAFDIVLLNRVASHLANLASLARELARVLSDSGRLVISDLAPEHEYVCTEFEAPQSRVLVETYKHTIEDWRREGQLNGMLMSYQHTISAENAEWLPSGGFSSIDRSSNRPVGFIVAFDRARKWSQVVSTSAFYEDNFEPTPP